MTKTKTNQGAVAAIFAVLVALMVGCGSSNEQPSAPPKQVALCALVLENADLSSFPPDARREVIRLCG